MAGRPGNMATSVDISRPRCFIHADSPTVWGMSQPIASLVSWLEKWGMLPHKRMHGLTCLITGDHCIQYSCRVKHKLCWIRRHKKSIQLCNPCRPRPAIECPSSACEKCKSLGTKCKFGHCFPKWEGEEGLKCATSINRGPDLLWQRRESHNYLLLPIL